MLVIIEASDFLNSFHTDFISYLNLTKENAVVVDVWLVTMSVEGSHPLCLLHHVMDGYHHPSLVRNHKIECFTLA